MITALLVQSKDEAFTSLFNVDALMISRGQASALVVSSALGVVVDGTEENEILGCEESNEEAEGGCVIHKIYEEISGRVSRGVTGKIGNVKDEREY